MERVDLIDNNIYRKLKIPQYTPKETPYYNLKQYKRLLEVLLEIHDQSELDYCSEYIDVLGVNNRNLGSFHTDVANSFRLIEQMPQEATPISESGISNPDTVKELRAIGFKGFLIGENFMKTEAPGDSLKSFINALN